MATAPAPPAVSVEEYLRTEYEPHCEYLDGELLAKPFADVIHGYLQVLIAAFLLSQERKFGLKIATELHIRVTPTRWRIPDIAALLLLPKDGRYPDAETPPLFTIEVASLDEPWPNLRGKVTDHLAMGVSTVIIVDPHNRTVIVANQSEALREIVAPLVVNIPVPGSGILSIDFDSLFQQL